MSFKEPEKKWLCFASGDALFDEYEESDYEEDSKKIEIARENRRREILTNLRGEIARHSKTIKNAFSQSIKLNEAKMIEGQKQRKLKVGIGDKDSIEESYMDFMEDVKNFPTDFFQGPIKEAWDNVGIFMGVNEAEMSKPLYPGFKEPLFSKEEIQKELYTPLVQQRLLPETFVPDAYSAVQKMINATNEEYKKELATASEEKSIGWELAQTALSTSATIVTSSLDIAFQAGGIDADARDLGKDIVSITEISGSTAIELTDQIIHDGVKPAAILKTILNKMSDAVATAIQMKTDDDDNILGNYVAISMKAAAGAITVAENIKDPKAAIIAALETSFNAAFDFSINAEKDDTKAVLEHVKAALQEGVRAAQLGAKAIDYIKKADPIDWSNVASLCLEGLDQAVSIGLRVEVAKKVAEKEEEQDPLKEKEESGTITDKESEQLVEVTDDIDELNEIDTSVQTSEMITTEKEEAEVDPFSKPIEISPKEMQAVAAKAQEGEKSLNDALREGMENIFKAEQEEFQEQMMLLSNPADMVGSEEELRSIAELTKKLKQDRQIWEQVNSIMAKGSALAKISLKALGPGPTLMTLIKTVTEAVWRAQELHQWNTNFDDAKLIPNPYLTSIHNFVKEQTEQVTHKSIQAALLLIKLAGEIAKLTPASVVGEVVSAGADIAMAAEDAIFSIYKQSDLKNAWAETKIALEHPEYRRQNLYVRKLNPTLAKYTIAYGATVAKDPIAVSTMNTIGITTDMLESPSAGVSAVKNYLETRYNEDMEVKMRFIDKNDWVKNLPEVSLEVNRWLLVIAKAKENHEGCVVDEPAIKKMLIQIEKDHTAYKDSDGNLLDSQKLFDDYQNLHGLFGTYSPVDSSGKALATMITVKEEYQTLLKAEGDFIRTVVTAKKKEAAALLS